MLLHLFSQRSKAICFCRPALSTHRTISSPSLSRHRLHSELVLDFSTTSGGGGGGGGCGPSRGARGGSGMLLFDGGRLVFPEAGSRREVAEKVEKKGGVWKRSHQMTTRASLSSF
jgi:hypothetical protein